MIAKYKQRFVRTLTTIAAAVVFALGSAVPALADTYNCGAYGAGAYQNNICGASTDSGGGAADGGGGLVDTGQSIWAILLAVLFILLGVYLLYRTRKNMKTHTAQQRR